MYKLARPPKSQKVQTSFAEFEYQNETHMTFLLLETDGTDYFISVSIFALFHIRLSANQI